MIYFFVIDGTAILAVILLALLVTGGSIKAISDFLANRIHEVYPYIVGAIVIGLVIYYLYKFVSYMSSMRRYGTEWNVCFKKIFPGMWLEHRFIITWLFNGIIAVVSPVTALGNLAIFISQEGIWGFLVDAILVFIFLLMIWIITWLFFKALDFANRLTISKIKMFFINIGFFLIQGFCYMVIECCKL